MTSQKQSLPSFASIVSVLLIVVYCAGFLRIEFELSEHKKRINAVENVVRAQPQTSRSNFIQMRKNVPELQLVRQRRRRADSPQSCLSCPPGPPGPPGLKGEKGSQGGRGKTGRNGKKDDRGIMASPGKSGKQGIMGPQGEAGSKGQKGDLGLPGKLGTKGEPGKSISDPTVAVSPSKMTVNESESASFQCSVTGNPEPTVVWSRVINQTEVSQSAVSGKMLRFRHVRGSDAGIYRCTATNILGKARAEIQLIVNGPPGSARPKGEKSSPARRGKTERNGKKDDRGILGSPRKSSKQGIIGPQGEAGSKGQRGDVGLPGKLGSKGEPGKSISDLTVAVSPSKMTVNESESASFQCSVTGNPEPTVVWSRVINQTEVSQSAVSGKMLYFRHVKGSDAGIYRCTATNILGKARAETQLIVNGPPGSARLKGEKSSPGRRGKTGRNGKKDDRGILGLPRKSSKQGIIGPQGEAGSKGPRGDVGLPGKQGTNGKPGKSISAPTVAVFPAKMTVNESESASFQCSVTGNPEPTVVWSRVINQTEVSQLSVSGKMLRFQNVEGSDAGVYRCTATNILGKAHALTYLEVNVQPSVSLHPGPLYISEGSSVTLPTCKVTGHPTPEVKWSKLFGQLPQGRVLRNNTEMKFKNAHKSDTAEYICTATNHLGSAVKKTVLVVVSLPRFSIKPPIRTLARLGDSLRLNCSATGDPQPVITWRRQGSPLPAGRSQQINGALVLRNFKKEDAGNYICVATSAGVFDIETVSFVELRRPRDCSDLLKSGQTHSGVYSIDPDGKGSFSVYCDMHTDGGGWIVFQRRQDGSIDFYRGWNDYKSGFGQLTAEFWLGNDKIHRLTASRPMSLRVELEDWNGAKAYAKYGQIIIGDEQAQYRLEVSSYSGTAGDSLAWHNNMAFTTKDRNNDQSIWNENAAVVWKGAWWYKSLEPESSLNGEFVNKGRGFWFGFRENLSLKFSEMKLRLSS